MLEEFKATSEGNWLGNIFENEILLQPTRFLLSWTSVGSVLSGTNWLGSSIFIGVPTLFPRCEDFIHWKKQTRIYSPHKNSINVVIELTTRGQTNTDELQLHFLHSQSGLGNNINWYRILTWKLMYHGFRPGADVPTGWVFGYIDLQITVRWVEPPGPLFLLFLQHKLKGAPQSQLMVLRGHSWHGGRNFHVILGARLLTDNGVPVRVTRSISLQSPKMGNIIHNSCLSSAAFSIILSKQ